MKRQTSLQMSRPLNFEAVGLPTPDSGSLPDSDPDNPRLLCDWCSFPLRPFLDDVFLYPGRRLCEDCFEDEQGLERFRGDEWLASHPLTEWHKEPVEVVLKVKR